MKPFFTNDAIVLGILMGILAFVFHTSGSESKNWQKLYRIVPPLLMCYFVPALLHWPLGIIANDWYEPGLWDTLKEMGLKPPTQATFSEMQQFLVAHNVEPAIYEPFKGESGLYKVASRFLLPASLILLCLGIDFKGIMSLGPKALIIFLTATTGIILGGPIALLVATNFFPGLVQISPDELWRGLSTIAGSWIGGGGNQMAMRAIFDVPQNVFGTMVVVDIIVGNFWMAILLYGAGIRPKIDKFLRADNRAIDELVVKVREFRAQIERMPTNKDIFSWLGLTFVGVAVSHWGAELITSWLDGFQDRLIAWRLDAINSKFFWIAVIATTYGLLASFTPARKLEGVGASRWGTIFLYFLVTTIGMQMDLGAILHNMGLFVIGIIWMFVHMVILIIVARIIKAPFFFVAVGSQANVGGAASAPIVASAFDSALAPVGVLLAVLGYALGTYGALISAFLMKFIATGG
jgi:uncharacterized membrane protein